MFALVYLLSSIPVGVYYCQNLSQIQMVLIENQSFRLHDLIETENENDISYKNDRSYLDIEDVENVCKEPFQFNVLHLNIRSIPAKINSLNMLLTNLNSSGLTFDFILLCETFLSNVNFDLFQIPNYTLVEKHRKNTMRGGVAIYVKNDYEFLLREDLSIFNEGEFESIFVEIQQKNKQKKLIIGEIYRVSNSSQRAFIESYDNLINKFIMKIKILL